jgi:hypothetical protein
VSLRDGTIEAPRDAPGNASRRPSRAIAARADGDIRRHRSVRSAARVQRSRRIGRMARWSSRCLMRAVGGRRVIAVPARDQNPPVINKASSAESVGGLTCFPEGVDHVPAFHEAKM